MISVQIIDEISHWIQIRAVLKLRQDRIRPMKKTRDYGIVDRYLRPVRTSNSSSSGQYEERNITKERQKYPIHFHFDAENAQIHIKSILSYQFKNVSFQYEPDKPVLKNLNFKVANGETVALVGHSGSGKSTLISLLMRFYDPQKGQIELDGQSLPDITLSSLRQ